MFIPGANELIWFDTWQLGYTTPELQGLLWAEFILECLLLLLHIPTDIGTSPCHKTAAETTPLIQNTLQGKEKSKVCSQYCIV